MKKIHLSILVATGLSLVFFSGCGSSSDDGDDSGLTPIEGTKGAAKAYTSIRISPEKEVYSPLTAVELAGKELSKDIKKVRTQGNTLGICYTGSVAYYKTGDSVATLQYNNCRVQNNKIINGKATLSPLSGANVTVHYEGYSIHYNNSFMTLDTVVSYSGWDTIESPTTSLNTVINGKAFSAHKIMQENDGSDNNATQEQLNGYGYDYMNMSVSMVLQNESISQYSATGAVALFSDCPAGRFQITTLKPMQVTNPSTLSSGNLKINNAEYSFGTSDSNESNVSGASVTLTIYGVTQTLSQTALTPSCSN